ncbi:TlpA family protein disulfide reductase [Sphingobacterium bovistauri]|uniref:TlpA family protein disulfide reductase n=1 Tax=Sphingobacterium bovistauri TaxID=2781959 RepID=A0ABS7Z7S2_9SPHI|nr:TlpA disulfide reductase family protein [Sphingobacterium bovistauri]MCA5006241.1 TlpA family protein disulfide reductase [Sphingobacterium bovistauri]
MRYLIILGFIIGHFIAFGQERSISPFVGIPDFAKQIRNAENEKDLMGLYSKFELDYPQEKFAQVHFLLDQVHIATAQRLIEWNNENALSYIIKIKNANDRVKMFEALPAKCWQLASTDSLVLAYNINANQTSTSFEDHHFVYAELLMHTGKHKESLEFLEKFSDIDQLIAKHPYLFINLYQKNNKLEKGISVLAALVKQGRGNENSKKMLKELWIEKYNNEEGFEAYYAEQLKVLTKDMEADLLSKIVSYDAPDFELRNLNGEKVRLSDLKGKVIFLDFWATWCGPCIASFPTMQRIIQQYKDNKDVVFLFVNTMERNLSESERVKKVKQLLDEKGFDFQVVLDVKNETNYELGSKYKLNSIPAQFIIDKNGQVRFSLNGFNGNRENMFHELNILIKHVLSL